jgi:ribosome biogenesis GTPase A
MDFVEFLKIQLSRVVKDFELNPLVIKKKDLVQKWQIPTIESLVFKILGNFQNYKFLEDWDQDTMFYLW